MSDKYAIRVTPSTYALCTFLNDGHFPDPNTTKQVLVVEVNGPREITTKLHRESEVLQGHTPKDPDIIMLVTE